MNVWIAWWEGRQQPRAFLKAFVLGGVYLEIGEVVSGLLLQRWKVICVSI